MQYLSVFHLQFISDYKPPLNLIVISHIPEILYGLQLFDKTIVWQERLCIYNH